jgi:23S rRNA (uracil1939-C5)-methyltransferase
MVEKNKEYLIDIEAVSSDGNGIGHIDGLTVFVPYTAAGDTVKAVITKLKSRFAYGSVTEIIKSSPDRIEPQCEKYEQCGGCQLRHMSYEAELREKRGIIENAMKRIGGFKDFSIPNVVGMENPQRYRNKMIFPVGYDNGLKCGFYAPKSHDIIEISDCILGDEANQSIIAAVTDYMRENNVSAYDEKNHTGLVRRIFTRKAFNTGEIMAVLSVNGTKIPNADALVNKLCAANKNIASIILNVNKKRGGMALGDRNITLYGKDTITDILCGVEFAISPHSFFQINPVQTEKLYGCALEFAELHGNETVMDIYCGIGTISLCAARHAKKVIGVEIVEQAIEDAKMNAQRNNISNAEFYADSAENIVPKLIESGERPDVVILDPPRKGSDEKTLSALIKAAPKRIVYVSCNPATLARDAAFLAERGYALENACGFDLFPRTMHVETVAIMRKNI